MAGRKRGGRRARDKGKRMKLLRLLFLFLWLAVGPVLAKPLCVEFELVKSVSKEGKVSEAAPQRVKVVLTKDYLEIQDADGRVVHDFLSNVSHLVNGDSYVRRSLYADIGFRVMELKNRLFLLEALRQAKVDAVPGGEVEVEHLFAVDDEQTEANISKTEGATVSYGSEGKLLAEFSSKGKKLTPEQSRAFVRFVRYYCGGHPDILSDVQVRGVLPERFRVDVSNVAEVTSYAMTTVSSAVCDPSRPDFSGLRPTVLPPEPLGTLVALALQLTPEAVPTAQALLQSRAETALAEGKALSSVLLLFEVLLMGGDGPPALLSEGRAQFEANADSKALFDALMAGSKDADLGAEMFQALEPRAGEQAHILKIFRAGMLVASDKRADAARLYLEALLVNPALAGAWKDLGDIYHANYDMDMAWLCWDVGRKLAPKHMMLQDVNRLEHSLRINYPGFF